MVTFVYTLILFVDKAATDIKTTFNIFLYWLYNNQYCPLLSKGLELFVVKRILVYKNSTRCIIASLEQYNTGVCMCVCHLRVHLLSSSSERVTVNSLL